MLSAIALMRIYEGMRPRARAAPAPKPESAMAVLRAVKRAHEGRGLTFVSLELCARLTKAMMRRYVEHHGIDTLAPQRKNPLTNALIAAMLSPAAICSHSSDDAVACAGAP